MTYLSLLLEWNEKMNLTAITEPREVVLKLCRLPEPCSLRGMEGRHARD